LPSAHENDDNEGKRTRGCLVGADFVTFGERRSSALRYEADCSPLSRLGLIFTTSHVIAAASAITLTIKTTRPSSPRAVAMTDLE
jgi:hypothetical protein